MLHYCYSFIDSVLKCCITLFIFFFLELITDINCWFVLDIKHPPGTCWCTPGAWPARPDHLYQCPVASRLLRLTILLRMSLCLMRTINPAAGPASIPAE